MQTVITITAKGAFRRAEIAAAIRHAASGSSERLEEGLGTFRFTDYAQHGQENRPVTVDHALFEEIKGIKIEDV